MNYTCLYLIKPNGVKTRKAVIDVTSKFRNTKIKDLDLYKEEDRETLARRLRDGWIEHGVKGEWEITHENLKFGFSAETRALLGVR